MDSINKFKRYISMILIFVMFVLTPLQLNFKYNNIELKKNEAEAEAVTLTVAAVLFAVTALSVGVTYSNKEKIIQAYNRFKDLHPDDFKKWYKDISTKYRFMLAFSKFNIIDTLAPGLNKTFGGDGFTLTNTSSKINRFADLKYNVNKLQSTLRKSIANIGVMNLSNSKPWENSGAFAWCPDDFFGFKKEMISKRFGDFEIRVITHHNSGDYSTHNLAEMFLDGSGMWACNNDTHAFKFHDVFVSDGEFGYYSKDLDMTTWVKYDFDYIKNLRYPDSLPYTSKYNIGTGLACIYDKVQVTDLEKAQDGGLYLHLNTTGWDLYNSSKGSIKKPFSIDKIVKFERFRVVDYLNAIHNSNLSIPDYSTTNDEPTYYQEIPIVPISNPDFSIPIGESGAIDDLENVISPDFEPDFLQYYKNVDTPGNLDFNPYTYPYHAVKEVPRVYHNSMEDLTYNKVISDPIPDVLPGDVPVEKPLTLEEVLDHSRAIPWDYPVFSDSVIPDTFVPEYVGTAEVDNPMPDNPPKPGDGGSGISGILGILQKILSFLLGALTGKLASIIDWLSKIHSPLRYLRLIYNVLSSWNFVQLFNNLATKVISHFPDLNLWSLSISKLKVIASVITSILDLLKAKLGTMSFPSVISTGLDFAIDKIKDVVISIPSVIGDLYLGLRDSISALPHALKVVFEGLYSGVVSSLVNSISSVKEFFKSIPSTLADILTSIISIPKIIATTIQEVLTYLFVPNLGALSSAYNELVDSFKLKFKDLFLLVNSVKSIYQTPKSIFDLEYNFDFYGNSINFRLPRIFESSINYLRYFLDGFFLLVCAVGIYRRLMPDKVVD